MFGLDGIFSGKKRKDRPDIALLVDGPNILRKAFNIDLVAVKRELGKYGNIRVARIYLDQYASDKLIEAMVNQGFETVTTTGRRGCHDGDRGHGIRARPGQWTYWR